ncbi:uncharacterized protein [Panulirus ornatus]|uniref:uncharacterized protein isoform X2 n=1 Tax=Panulirus ornatus TaxID=150431 RepID=UPI003A876F61
MDGKHFVWNAQNGDIWEVANELQEKAVHVDVYLQAIRNESCNVKDIDCNVFNKLPSSKEKVTKNVTFPAHKLMLAAASPFLNKVLNEHYHDHHDSCVNITVPNVSPDALHYILNFIYCGDVNIPLAVREQVLEAAKLLQVSNLIDYFQPNCIKLEEMNEEESKVLETEVDKPLSDIMKVPPKKRGRKRKIPRLQPVIDETSSMNLTKIQKEKCILTEPKMYLDNQLGRCHRKIKSRYSSDIYEVNIPKLRKCKSTGLHSEVKQEQKSEQSFEETKESSSHTCILKTNSKLPKMNEDCDVNVLVDNIDVDKKDFTNLPPGTSNVFESKFTKMEDIDPDLLTLPSTSASSSSSVVITHLFASDSSYLQESNRSQSLKEIPCTSFIDPQVSMASTTKESYESSSLIVASSSSSLLSQIKELPVTASPTMQDLPLKQVSGISHTQVTSDTLQEKIADEEQEEDGLLKWQVLFKECENFTETVGPTPRDSVGDGVQNITVKYQDGGVDINQWMSEEFHSYITPETGDGDEFCKETEDSLENKAKSSSAECITNEASRLECNDTENDKASYGCEKCGRTYADLRSCQAHIQGVHHEARQMCKYCGKMFKRRCDLYQHERRHNTATLPCKYCGKIFKLPKDLAAHMMTHTGRKRFHCSHCNKQLTSFRNLRNHIASIHQKQRAFACHLCNKTYSKSCSLQVHIRSVHTGERPFKCIVCNKGFCDSALLRLHNVVHTGERKYSCKVCDRRFNQYSNMVSHQRVHTNDRPFTCVICKENFKTREGLLKHKWVHTGLKPLRCRHCSKEFRIKESYERHMLKCHGEVINVPEIYFEVPEEIILDEPSKNSSSSSVTVFKNIGDSDIPEASSIHISSNFSDKLLQKKTVSKNSEHDSVPIVHLVRNIAQERSSSLPLTSNDSGHVQLNYPLFSSNANVEENESITLGSLTNHISSGETGSQSVDVESFLHEEVSVPNSNAVVISRDSKADVLSSSIHETVISECKEVVILSEASESCVDELSSNIHPSSTIKIWMPNERSVAEDTDDDSDNRNILIVSDQTFTDSDQTLPVLSSGLVSQEVVQTMILDTPQDKHQSTL